MDKEKNGGKKPVEKRKEPSIEGDKFQEDLNGNDIIEDRDKGGEKDSKKKDS